MSKAFEVCFPNPNIEVEIVLAVSIFESLLLKVLSQWLRIRLCERMSGLRRGNQAAQ
jgi:hypothetical protein